jgi:hypothetical protein
MYRFGRGKSPHAKAAAKVITTGYGMLPTPHPVGSREAARGKAERAHTGNPAPDWPFGRAQCLKLQKTGQHPVTSTHDVLQNAERTAAITGGTWMR